MGDIITKPVVAPSLPTQEKKPKSKDKDEGKYFKEFLKMIQILTNLEVMLTKFLSANTVNQSQITKVSANMSNKLFNKQVKELGDLEKKQKEQQKWEPFIKAFEWLSVAAGSLLAFATGGLAAGAVVAAVSVLCASGALNKMVDKVLPDNASSTDKALFKIAIIATVTAGSGFAAGALESGTDAAEEGADEATTAAATKATSNFSKFAATGAATQTLVTLNPTQDLIYTALKSAGVDKEKAKMIAGIVSIVVNIIASIAAFKVAGPTSVKNMPSATTVMNLAAGTFFLSNAAEGVSLIMQGKVGLDISNIQRIIADGQRAEELLEGSTSINDNGKSETTTEYIAKVRSFQGMNSCFSAISLPYQTAANVMLQG